MRKLHNIFGYKYPKYTKHFLYRYAERIYNIKYDYIESWLKFNYKKIVTEITNQLYDSVKLDITDIDNVYFLQKYGKDVLLLKNKRNIFVIRNYINIVTIYKLNK